VHTHILFCFFDLAWLSCNFHNLSSYLCIKSGAKYLQKSLKLSNKRTHTTVLLFAKGRHIFVDHTSRQLTKILTAFWKFECVCVCERVCVCVVECVCVCVCTVCVWMGCCVCSRIRVCGCVWCVCGVCDVCVFVCADYIITFS